MIVCKFLRKIRIYLKITFFKILYKKQLKLKKNVSFLKGFNINIRGKGNLTIGEDTFFNNYCSINCMGNIEIGNNCAFGENVKIYDHNHQFRMKDVAIKDQGFTIADVKIGDNCWIGSNVTILKGVTLGNNVVVGANCLIYKSIKDNQIVKCANNQIISNIEFLNK